MQGTNINSQEAERRDHQQILRDEKLKELKKRLASLNISDAKAEKSDFDPKEDPLQLITGKRPNLPDLKVRPDGSGKKTSGDLEVHANGFRFISKEGENLDVIFKNIKHAFFQPCDNDEMIVLIHFRLHKPITIENQSSIDVQFYTEVALETEDLDSSKRDNNNYETETEEERRSQRKKLNEEFMAFTRAAEAASGGQIEYEIPYKELAFQGVPFKCMSYLYPTVQCLVNLIEYPFFVLTLDEVEIAHFERVQPWLKNFDLTFIFKDYTKPVSCICAVPSNYLDPIKNWLDKMDIIYSESGVNLQWPNILKEIRKDLKVFVESGGWNFLQEDQED